MILVDANLLLYAYDGSSPFHERARNWWQDQLSKPDPVRLAWSTIIAFIRIGTHPRVYEQPLQIDEAVAQVESWLERPMVDTLEPSTRHWAILSQLINTSQASGNLVTDAHLAALAIEHGATLCSSDRDFSRFDQLDWNNPMEG
ncbi:MAG: twitching motility protein PilT [Deltaproteobacteria bacterium RIFOXYA12_FULL_58_15]|nr:MAG: twitching motility protein PilT [Deltaproteobacteria bacterium RIFOXYA12_FULL_58_15]OGR13102.1 MAG: twitching motility protein PilT [Deltaproteobacteria bacterium RIFOXYB12_FULL_58_9]